MFLGLTDFGWPRIHILFTCELVALWCCDLVTRPCINCLHSMFPVACVLLIYSTYNHVIKLTLNRIEIKEITKTFLCKKKKNVYNKSMNQTTVCHSYIVLYLVHVFCTGPIWVFLYKYNYWLIGNPYFRVPQ